MRLRLIGLRGVLFCHTRMVWVLAVSVYRSLIDSDAITVSGVYPITGLYPMI